MFDDRPLHPTFPAALHNQEEGVQLGERRGSVGDLQRERRLWSNVAMTFNVIGYFFVFLFFLHVLYIEIKSKALLLCCVWLFFGRRWFLQSRQSICYCCEFSVGKLCSDDISSSKLLSGVDSWVMSYSVMKDVIAHLSSG